MPDCHIGDAADLIDAAVEQAVELPSNSTFRTWCRAHLAGRVNEEAVKRAFRSVWWGLANGRFDDFMQLLAHAEARAAMLRPETIVGWAQAAAARAALELMWAHRLDPIGAQAQRERAAHIAAGALRFAQLARRGGALQNRDAARYSSVEAG